MDILINDNKDHMIFASERQMEIQNENHVF